MLRIQHLFFQPAYWQNILNLLPVFLIILESLWLPSQLYGINLFCSLLLVKICLTVVPSLFDLCILSHLTCFFTFLPSSLNEQLGNIAFEVLTLTVQSFLPFFFELSSRYLRLCYISVFSITLCKLESEHLVALGEGCHLISQQLLLYTCDCI